MLAKVKNNTVFYFIDLISYLETENEAVKQKVSNFRLTFRNPQLKTHN